MEENSMKKPSAAASIFLFLLFTVINVIVTFPMLDSVLGLFNFKVVDLIMEMPGFTYFYSIIAVPGSIVGLITVISLLRQKNKGALASISVLLFINAGLGILKFDAGIHYDAIIDMLALILLGIMVAITKSNLIKSALPVNVVSLLCFLIVVWNTFRYSGNGIVFILISIYYLILILGVILTCKYHINCTSFEQTAAKNTDYQQSAVNNQGKTLNIEVAEKIKEYKELLDMGIINQEEFETKKKKLLNL